MQPEMITAGKEPEADLRIEGLRRLKKKRNLGRHLLPHVFVNALPWTIWPLLSHDE